MLKLLLIFFTVILFSFKITFAGNLDFSQTDKQKHFFFSSIFSIGFNKYLYINQITPNKENRIIETIFYSNIPGFIKEILDHQEKNNKFDTEDLKANFLGTIAGTYLSEQTNYPIFIKYSKENIFFFTNFKF